jgi:CRISPR-associated endonuclease Cas2
MSKPTMGKKLILLAAEDLFELAKNVGELLEEIIFTPYGKLRIGGVPRTTYYHKLERYERHGLVKKVRKKYGNHYILTEKAKQLRKNPRIKINRTDDLSTIIMFDIPEEKHKARDTFRRFLLKNGYTHLQKSVFISPFKIFGELKDLAKELKIDRDITVISGKVDQTKF